MTDLRNDAANVSPVAPAPVVETKYITKNIEDIQAGDEVLAYDVQTGETVRSKVVSTVHLKCDHLRYLTVRDDKGAEQTFQTTDTHPFWVNTDRPEQYRKARDSVSEHDVSTNTDVPFEHEDLIVTENGFYVEAKDLKIGDSFIGPNGEVSFLIRTWRESYPEGIDVYNINVADNSNYFVIANYADFQNGSGPVLVHNGKKCGNKARFIVDSKGNIVDLQATKRGRYIQPYKYPGSIDVETDILQGADHGFGRSHTHIPEYNKTPDGEMYPKNRDEWDIKPPSYSDIKNIMNGIAERAQPKGR